MVGVISKPVMVFNVVEKENRIKRGNYLVWLV